jgi:uncharacterized membrane protein (GlpM family)
VNLFETSLLAKALWSAAIVLCLTWLAERVSTRIAGIVSGAPQNVVLVFFFVGRDMGISFVTKSAPHGVAAFTATIGFVLAYYGASLRFTRYSAFWSSLIAVMVFVAIAAALSTIPFTLASATVMTFGVIGLASWLFRNVELTPVKNPVRYTARLLVARACLAAAFIVGAITLAEMLGTRWTGLLAGFPAILLPTLLIIHTTYGRASTHAIIRNFPVGVVSIILYILSVPITFPLLGVYVGTLASLAVSLAYLATIAVWGGGRQTQKSVEAGTQPL